MCISFVMSMCISFVMSVCISHDYCRMLAGHGLPVAAASSTFAVCSPPPSAPAHAMHKQTHTLSHLAFFCENVPAAFFFD
jgi:hypothetical protein